MNKVYDYIDSVIPGAGPQTAAYTVRYSREREGRSRNGTFGKYHTFHPYAEYVTPGEKVQNYPGGEACFESGRDVWTYKTLYHDVCP